MDQHEYFQELNALMARRREELDQLRNLASTRIHMGTNAMLFRRTFYPNSKMETRNGLSPLQEESCR